MQAGPVFEGLFVVRGFVEKKVEYQLARVGEEEVRVRTRHENLRGVGEVKGESKDEVTRVEGVRGEGEEKEFLVKWERVQREDVGERSVFEGGRAEGEGVLQAEEEKQEEKGEES